MTITETAKDTLKSAVGASDEPRESLPVPSQPSCLGRLDQ